MKRYRILHRTYYNFSAPVVLGEHTLRLRPREGHDLRIETSTLEIEPAAQLRWLRDADDNVVAVARFEGQTRQLSVISDVVVEQYLTEAGVLGRDRARGFVMAAYSDADRARLQPYLALPLLQQQPVDAVTAWLNRCGPARRDESVDEALARWCRCIYSELRYRVRTEPGVQTPDETLALGSGACRDFAALFMEAARRAGLAARFVSGYLHTEHGSPGYGATHAWAEVYLTAHGWCGFDPTLGREIGTEHFAVSVSPTAVGVPPISGSFVGAAQSTLEVGVWVTALAPRE